MASPGELLLLSCADLTSTLARDAASSATSMRALLARFAELARPGEGSPKIFLALARLCEQPWVEGRLRVEISGGDDVTQIEVLSELGVGIVERLLPLTKLAVPFDEFVRAIDLAPDLMLPLRATDADHKIILTPLFTPEELAASTTPAFELDDKSLGDGERITAPPPAMDPDAFGGARLDGDGDEMIRPFVSEPPETPLVDARPTPVMSAQLASEAPPTPRAEARPTPVVPVDAVAMKEARPRHDPRREPD